MKYEYKIMSILNEYNNIKDFNIGIELEVKPKTFIDEDNRMPYTLREDIEIDCNHVMKKYNLSLEDLIRDYKMSVRITKYWDWHITKTQVVLKY